MRICVAQINSRVAGFKENADKILSIAVKARETQRADLLLFPAMSLTGSPLLDLQKDGHFAELCDETVDYLIQKLPRDIAVGIGYVRESIIREHRETYGIIFDGDMVYSMSKGSMGNTDFTCDYNAIPFNHMGEQIYLAFEDNHDLIPHCVYREISWHWNRHRRLKRKKANISCVILSTMPFMMGEMYYVWDFGDDRLNAMHISKDWADRYPFHTKIPIFYVNAVGASAETVFGGGSFVAANNNGISAKIFEEDLILWDSQDETGSNSVSLRQKRIGNYHKLDLLEKALVLGIRDYMEKSGFTRAHLGLSGGIDSALAAYLAAEAVGAENITAISMPSRFSSQGSKDDAEELAANLGCPYEILPIEKCYEAFTSTLNGLFEDLPFDIAEENLQARIRGVLNMAFSNKFNSMLISTGNKSEIAMGYSTLYGDTNGALAPIGDLLKTEVIALCRRINERSVENSGKKIIPQAIIDKPPSAELRPDQKDEDSLPPYETLDAILKLYLPGNFSRDEIVERGYDRETVDRIIKTIARTEYKRRQLPPVINVSSFPFSRRQMPLVREIYEC